MVYFKNSERIFFGHFLTKMHIFAINRHLKLVESCKFVWWSSNHLSKSCKKSSLYLLAVTNDSVFKSAQIFFGTPCILGARFTLPSKPPFRDRISKGKPSFQDRISKGKPRFQYRISKGKPRFQYRISKGKPRFQDRISKGKPSFQDCISKGKPSFQYRISKGKPSFQDCISKGKPRFQ